MPTSWRAPTSPSGASPARPGSSRVRSSTCRASPRTAPGARRPHRAPELTSRPSRRAPRPPPPPAIVDLRWRAVARLHSLDRPLLLRPAAVRPADVRHAYVHVPFCPTICPFCDFHVLERRAGIVDAYLDRLAEEARHSAARLDLTPGALETLYLGGGTPSHLRDGELARLVEALRQ